MEENQLAYTILEYHRTEVFVESLTTPLDFSLHGYSVNTSHYLLNPITAEKPMS